MTQPTDIPQPPQPDGAAPGGAQDPADAADAEAQPLVLRRILRTESSETFDLAGSDGVRLGSLTVTYGPDAVEGLFAMPPETQPDVVRGLLAWVTEMLNLDNAVGPGGQIHWVVATGPLEDFWRRSPGRRPTGAEADLDSTRARVEAVLRQMFPEVMELEDGGYAVDAGSVRVFVQSRIVDQTPLVRVFSITNVDVPPEGGIAPFLLNANFHLPLGRFALDTQNRAVWCDHVLSVDELSDGALARAIGGIAMTADRFDDEIKERFGGRTFREEGSPVAQVPQGGPSMAGGYL